MQVITIILNVNKNDQLNQIKFNHDIELIKTIQTNKSFLKKTFRVNKKIYFLTLILI